MVTTRKAEPRPPIAGDQLLADLAELLVLAVVEIYQDTGGVILSVRPKRVRCFECREFTADRLDEAITLALVWARSGF